MKVCIIPDSHGRHPQIDQMLAWEEPYDQAIFLGDYFHFDSDTPEDSRDCAAWVQSKLADPRHILLWGNHDVGTRFWCDNPWAPCHAVTPEKTRAARAVLGDEDWAKLRLYHAIPEWNLLFTHAGVDHYLISMLASKGWETPKGHLNLRATTEWLDLIRPQVWTRFHHGPMHPVVEQGKSRGGVQPTGGIIWQDLDEFRPIPGLGQIFGHSIRDVPLFRFHQEGARAKAPMWRRAGVKIKTHWLEQGWGLGLDTQSRHYAVLDTATGILTIEAVHWSRNWEEGGFTIRPTGTISTIQLPRPGAPQRGPKIAAEGTEDNSPIRDGGWEAP